MNDFNFFLSADPLPFLSKCIDTIFGWEDLHGAAKQASFILACKKRNILMFKN